MKKFAKMSLVAAVAVAGMTTANAKDLTEAIKGVDVSGTVVYRYEDYSVENGSSTTKNRYKAGITFKSPVNDDVTANTRFLATDHASGSFTDLDTSSDADSNVEVRLSQVNFTYTGLANTSVSFGKLGVQTPWTNAVDSDGSEQTGTGILAASTFGPVTGVAGYLNQTNFAGAGKNVALVALLGSAGPVNAEAWYLDISDSSDTYFVKASASFDLDGVKLGAYAQTSQTDEDANNNDLGLTKLGLSAKAGMFNAGVTYAETEKDGAGLAGINSVSKSSAIGWNQTIAKKTDADMILLDLGAQVTPELHIGLNYDAIDDEGAADTEETFVQATYNMSKNFMTYVRFGEFTTDTANSDETRGRLMVQYSF